jgi:hypothetical protein
MPIKRENIMEKMIAYCGLTCTDCPAYTATQANDREALERVAAQWRKAFKAPEITADSILCDGCLNSNGRLSGYCKSCQIRVCAGERGVTNCAACDEYACETLRGFFKHAPEAENTLDSLRAARA